MEEEKEEEEEKSITMFRKPTTEAQPESDESVSHL
jgi:hypothetical protein